jgi:hypothetical protein
VTKFFGNVLNRMKTWRITPSKRRVSHTARKHFNLSITSEMTEIIIKDENLINLKDKVVVITGNGQSEFGNARD